LNPVLLGGALIFLSVLIAYWPALRGGFIWDDDAYVTTNPLLTAPDGLRQIWFSAHRQSQYFPLVYTTLRLERALWGVNPFGYHVVNVLLHGANALLVLALLRRLAVPGAWLASALFALHPVQVETVAWVTELKNTESTLFYLLALLAWMRFTDETMVHRWRFYGLAILLHAAALFSKTTACTLPAVMILTLWLQGRRPRWRWLAQTAPFVVMGLAMGLVSIWWERHMGNYGKEYGLGFNAIERLLIATHGLWFYLGKLVWPVHLTFSYPRWNLNIHDFRQYGWGIGFLAVAALSWWRRQVVGRGTLAAFLFFVVVLAPMLGFIPLFTFYYTFVADHYQYLACLGPLAFMAAAMTRLATRCRAPVPAQFACCLLLLWGLGALTWHQAGAYRDIETLWRDTIGKNPRSWLAHNNLGLLLAAQGRNTEAEAEYNEVLRLKPDSWTAHNDLGTLLSAEGRKAEAEAQLNEALRLKPDDPDVQYNLANLLATTGRIREAIPHYEQALQLKPDDGDMHNNLGVAFYSIHEADPAVLQFREAIRCKPESANFHCNLGNAFLAQHRLNEATREYMRALELNPDYAEPRARLRSLGANLRHRDD
jgi:tetratricopeptide (TPR) repeat protein